MREPSRAETLHESTDILDASPAFVVRRVHRTDDQVMKPRIMYIESKAGGLSGPARVGRVTFSKTSKTLYYQCRSFQNLKGADSNRTSMTSQPVRSTGFPVLGETAPTGCTAAATLWR